jgi:lipopolysaccharide heptosyltransferase II
MNGTKSPRRLKILIIRLSSIGDILLSTPFIRQIRHKYSNSFIAYVVKKRFADLLRFNPHLDTVIEFDEQNGLYPLQKVRNQIRSAHYDYILDLHNNWRSNFLRFGYQTGFQGRIKKDKIRQICLVYLKKNIYKEIVPIPQRYLKVGSNLGIEDDRQGLEIFWNSRIESQTKSNLQQKKLDLDIEKYICIAPGAGFYTKRWPPEYFNQLISSLLHIYDDKLVILGGPEERYLQALFPPGDRVINLAAETNLLQSAILLSKARALIVNDTGLMHMATAVKTPVLAIFGNTVEEFGFFPYRGNTIVVQNKNLYCRPCSHIGKNNCPEGHFKCMFDLTPARVLEQFDKLLPEAGY